MNSFGANTNKVASNRTSIVRTGRVVAADLVQLFYRSSSGLEILGTNFELLVTAAKPDWVPFDGS